MSSACAASSAPHAPTARANASSPGKPSSGAPRRGLQLGAQRVAVEAGRLVGLVLVHRLALHNLAFACVQRRKLVLRLLQGSDFRFDAEQQRDKILQMRRDGDQQRRLLAAVERGRARAGGDEPLRQSGIRRAQEREERRVDASKALGRVQVRKSQSKSELQHQGAFAAAPAAKSDAGRRQDRANPIFYLRDDAATGPSRISIELRRRCGDEEA